MQNGGVSNLPPPSSSPPGWYLDPWQPAGWRWWDGSSWTGHVASAGQRKPRLPGWLSVPVCVAVLPVLAMLVVMTVVSPATTLLGLVPMLIVGPTMAWLDRVEPEPRSSIVHAFLWGATVAVGVAVIVNTIVIGLLGEVAGVVVCAPLIEEAMKGLGVVWAARRRQIDGVMDGIVYAGWVALGFAVVEDITYFVSASDGGILVGTFVVRALLGPFAHPLFTSWTGMAVGRAVVRRRAIWPSILGGYALAVGSHALWNGSLTAASKWGDSGLVVAGVAVLVFVGLFGTFAVVLYRLRRRDEHRFLQLVPWLAARYQLMPEEVRPFAEVGATLRARRSLPRSQRRHFDRVHAALARLAQLHDRPGGADADSEARLVENLQRARATR